jgi:hypothetical protein
MGGVITKPSQPRTKGRDSVPAFAILVRDLCATLATFAGNALTGERALLNSLKKLFSNTAQIQHVKPPKPSQSAQPQQTKPDIPPNILNVYYAGFAIIEIDRNSSRPQATKPAAFPI